MLVNLLEPGEQCTGYWLHAGPDPSNPYEVGGMTWCAYVSPSQIPVKFDAGTLYLVQLITPGIGYIDTSNREWVNGAGGQLGLDTQFPYAGGWDVYEDSARTAQPDDESNDSPGLALTSLIYGFVSETFQDYIMYKPPASSAYVPLGTFTWSKNGAAIIPSTNNWADFTNPAGPVTPSGSFGRFTPQNFYPSWSRNSGNGIGFVPVQ